MLKTWASILLFENILSVDREKNMVTEVTTALEKFKYRDYGFGWNI